MIENKKIFAIIMAAGKGTRIGATDKPKVMFEVGSKPIIEWAIRPLEELKNQNIVDRIVTVVGFLGDQVVDYLLKRTEFVWQKEQLGTGHAVMQTESMLSDESGFTLIVNGDHALYSAKTYKKMIDTAIHDNLTLGFAVVNTPNRFSSYGRVIRDDSGKVIKVVEEPDATEEEKTIAERSINLYIVDNKWLFETLKKIGNQNVKHEYYINEIVMLAATQGVKLEAIEIENEDEALGINTLEDRAEVEKILEREGLIQKS